MKIPSKYISPEEQSLINDNGVLIAMNTSSYMAWREQLSVQPRLKSLFAMTSMLLIAKNASAIAACVDSGHTDAARSLLRINVETYINLLYVYTRPHNQAYLRLGYSAEMLYLSNIDKYEVFTNATYTSKKLTPEDFNSFRKPFRKAKKQWEQLNHGQAVKNVPDLRTRTEEIKKRLGVVWPSELYYNSYLFLSEDVHATPSSIFGLAMREDFDEMWFGIQKYKSIRDTIKIQNEILASTMYFLKKTGLKFETPLTDYSMIAKYNKHRIYKNFII